MEIGFVGLGDQGAPMAVAIAERFPLHVWARRETSYQSIAGSPAMRHANVAELASSVQILCVCLRTDEDLHALLGDALGAMRPGSILINHATGDPNEAKHFAALCKERKLGFIDAPVSGGRPGAISRSLTCFVGSEDDTLAACETVLASHSSHIVHMGKPGSGQAAKLCNNALTVSNLRNIVEVFAIADRMGVAPSRLKEAFAHSSGGSFILDALGSKITPAIAAHIAQLNRTDVAEFAAAAERSGCDAGTIADWAYGGAEGLEALVGQLEEGMATRL